MRRHMPAGQLKNSNVTKLLAYPRDTTPMIYPRDTTPMTYPRDTTPMAYPRDTTPMTFRIRSNVCGKNCRACAC